MRRQVSQHPDMALREAPDRHLPHSTEAEQGVLGCVLLEPATCLPLVLARMESGGMMDGTGLFYDLKHEGLLRACQKVWEEDGTLDPIVLQQRLRDWNQLDQIGGIAFVAALMNEVPSAASLPYYLDILWEKFLLRKAVVTGTRMVSRVYESEGEVERLIGGIEREMEEFKDLATKGFGVRPQVLQRAAAFAERAYERFMRVETGLPGWHMPFGFPVGFRKGELTLLSGDNGSGKTSMLSHLAVDVAKQIEAATGATKEELVEAGFGPEDRLCIASFEMSPDVSVWIALRQLLAREKLLPGDAGLEEFTAGMGWLNRYFWFHDFVGIGHWRDVLDAFRYARDHENCRFFVLDSIMRVGIPEDDLTQQSLAAAEFATFVMEAGKESHCIIVGHENKAGVGAKNKVQGSKRWSDNAHVMCQMLRNEAKAEKMAEFGEEFKAAKARGDEGNMQRLAKLLSDQREVWDSKFLLHKQRYPGAPQNGSAHLFFDRETLQFRKRLEDAPTRYLPSGRVGAGIEN